MRFQLLIAAAALALAAGCDRNEPAKSTSSSAPASSPSASSGATTPQAQPNIPTTPSPSSGATSQAERKDGTNPVQGQVDPKQREQHKDFQQKGDAAGPTSPDTKPKN
jgi:hypothetical protein